MGGGEKEEFIKLNNVTNGARTFKFKGEMMKKILLLTAVVLLAGFVVAAQAAPITVDNPLWYEFAFTTVGVDATNGTGTVPSSGGNSQYAPDAPWTFTFGAPTFLTVVDAFLEGDAFNVFDFGSSIGATSAVAKTGNNSGTSDPVVALTIPELSRGYFYLPAGSHSITIQPYQVVSTGAAYFMVSHSCPCPPPAAPIPGSLVLLGSGILGLVGIGVRRKF
jgi:hypothetical protein